MHLIPTVIEKDKNHQYAYDIYSKLLEERIILLTGTIDDAMASSIIGQLLYLEAQDNKNDIYIDVLCECGERVLVMVYRKQKLCEYLQREDIKSFLCDNGYPKEFSLTKYLAILKSRIYAQRLMNKEFPHEIGAFLGYPLHDIYGFINHKHQGCLLTGEWKVYENTEQAEKLFCRYNKCRRAVIKRINEGRTLKDLFCIA